MIPDFALHLSFEGISLLHRTAEGWASLGEVPLDAADLGGELVRLQKAGLGSGTPWRGTKVLLPAEQVRVLSLDGLRGEAEARAALEGLTPYAVADLVTDVVQHEGRTHVAAVARETLAEAETFADEHGFAPVCFAAALAAAGFPGEAFFGAARGAAGILGPEPVLRDPETLAPGTVTLDPVAREPGVEVAVEAEEPSGEVLPAELPMEAGLEPEPVVQPEPAAAIAAVDAVDSPQVAEPQVVAPLAVATAEAEADALEKQAAASPVAAEMHAPEPAPPVVEEMAAAPEAPPIPPSVAVPEAVVASRSRPLSGQARPLGPAPQKGPVASRAEPPVASAGAAGWAMGATPGGRPDPRLMPRAKAPPAPPASPAKEVPAAAPAREPVRLEPPKPSRSSPFGSLEPKPQRERIGGKPRFLGLILTVLLLILMAAVALFVTGPDRIAGLFQQAAPATLEPSVTQVEPEAALPASGGETAAPVAPESMASAVATPATSAAPMTPEVEDAAPESVVAALPQPAPADGTVATPTPEANKAASAAVAAAIAALPRATEEAAPAGTATEPAAADRLSAATGDWMLAPLTPALPEVGGAEVPELPATLPSKAISDLPVLAAADADAPPEAEPASEPVRVAEAAAPRPSRLPPTRPGALEAAEPAVASAATEPPAIRIPRRPAASAALAAEATVAPESPSAPWANAMAEAPAIQIPARPAAPPEMVAALAAAPPASESMAFAAQPTTGAPPAPLGDLRLAGLRPEARPQGFSPVVPEPEPVILASYDGPRPGARPQGLAPQDLPSADVSGALAEALAQPETQPGAQPETQPEAQPVPEAPAAPDLQSTLAAIVQGAPDPLAGATRQAVASVRVPDVRPRNFGRVVESQLGRQNRAAQAQGNRAAAAGNGASGLTAQEQAEAGEAEVASSAAAAPSGPTAASVAQVATRSGSIALREINLIGVYGQPNARRALVRMDNGRYLRVGVGDELDGGQVTAIGDNALNYVRRGRTYALVIPGG